MTNQVVTFNFNNNQVRTEFIWERPNSKLGHEDGVRKTYITILNAIKNYLDKESQFLYALVKRLKPLDNTHGYPRQIGNFFMSFYERESANILNKHKLLLSAVSISRSPKAFRPF